MAGSSRMGRASVTTAAEAAAAAVAGAVAVTDGGAGNAGKLFKLDEAGKAEGLDLAEQDALETWRTTVQNDGDPGASISGDAEDGATATDSLSEDADLLPGNISNLDTYGYQRRIITMNGHTIDDITGWTVDDSVDIADWDGLTTLELLLRDDSGTKRLSVLRMVT